MKQLTMVIVENDEDEQFFMKQAFDSTGLFQISGQLRNGDILVEWLKEHQMNLPDVILSDLNMPGMNGFDIIAYIKENSAYAHIPVIIISTSSTKTIIEKCFANGAIEYIIKPDTFVEYVPFAKKIHSLILEKQLVK